MNRLSSAASTTASRSQKAGVERQVFDLSLREAAASSVISRQGVVSGKLGKAWRPDRAFPIVFQMVEPRRDFEHRGSAATLGIGQTDAIEELQKRICVVMRTLPGSLRGQRLYGS